MSTIPFMTAYMVMRPMERVPSFSAMFRRWNMTVAVDMLSVSAISLFIYPFTVRAVCGVCGALQREERLEQFALGACDIHRTEL